MRTTIDIPDELFRQVKARAALDGEKLKDIITRFVEIGLRESSPGRTVPSPRIRSPLPVIREAATGVSIPAVSRLAIAAAEEDEDLAKLHRSTRR